MNRYVMWWLAVLAATSIAVSGSPVTHTNDSSASTSTELVAKWNGGYLTLANHEEWLEWRGAIRSDEAIREHIYQSRLIELAKANGLDQQVEVRMEISLASSRALVSALKRLSDESIRITDAEIERLQLEHPDAYQRPAKHLLRQIFKSLPEDPAAASEVRAAMRSIHARLSDGADFKNLAQDESEVSSRFRQGYIGYIDVSQLAPTIANALQNLSEGQLSPVIETKTGLTIFFCEGVRAADQPSPEEIARKMRNKLTRIRRAEAWEALRRSATESVRINRDDATTVAQAGEHRLDRQSFKALYGLHSTKSSTPAEDEERIIADWGVAMLLGDIARERGLHKQHEVALQLKWASHLVLVRRQLAGMISVNQSPPTTDELRSFFNDNQNTYRQLRRHLVFGILFADTSPRAAEVEVARQVLRQIEKKQMTFEQAAADYSRHPTKADQGRLGWLSAIELGALSPILPKAALQLEPGEHSGLIRAESGLWAFQIRDSAPPGPMTFEDARDRVAADFQAAVSQSTAISAREQILSELDIELIDRHSDDGSAH